MRITISGPPGSGKTTACRILSEKLGMEATVFGEFFRKLAKERGMDLAEFSRLAELDPSIDETIDGMILDVAKANSNMILESRLSAYMLTKSGIPAFRVYLGASPEVRLKRVGIRDGESPEDVYRHTIERQSSEAKRYKMYYDIDIEDKSVYDLILNTDDMDPDQVVDRILKGIEEST
ncbi:MAG: AAA family ATPase [Candidatus Methanoplasma sp.]|jgi:predicted cytidylate kinase|nr:AAA family ATPase [Candidatus Methanoplasma sp.]